MNRYEKTDLQRAVSAVNKVEALYRALGYVYDGHFTAQKVEVLLPMNPSPVLVDNSWELRQMLHQLASALGFVYDSNSYKFVRVKKETKKS